MKIEPLNPFKDFFVIGLTISW